MNTLVRLLTIRKRMWVALLVGMVCGALVPEARTPVTRALVGWNVGVWLYLALAAHMMANADHGKLKRIAAAHAEGARVVLVVVIVAALMSVFAIVVELSAAKGAAARTALPHLLFALSTVAGSWVLLPTLFTLDYASQYYRPAKGGGLGFPGDDAEFEPDYADFAYFAFTIAVASQTSDVTVKSRTMRRLVLAQSLLSFVFNTTILALTINMAAGLF
jgi:uncharacterized membrane protein